MSSRVTSQYIERLNELIKKKSDDYSATIDFLFRIMDDVINNYQFEKNALEKGTVYIVGTTGAGKSTLLNYLARKRLKVVEEDDGTIRL